MESSTYLLAPIYSNCFLSFFQWQMFETITTLFKTCIIPMKNYVLYFTYEFVIHTFIVYTKLFKMLTKNLNFQKIWLKLNNKTNKSDPASNFYQVLNFHSSPGVYIYSGKNE